MIYKTEEELSAAIEKLINLDATEAEWTHAAHLIVALWFATRHDLETATAKMRDLIFRLNAAHGVENTETDGYHETLTVFWMRTVFDYARSVEPKNFSLCRLANEICAEFDSRYPLKFYSREFLFSPAARRKFVAPDLVETEKYQQNSQLIVK